MSFSNRFSIHSYSLLFEGSVLSLSQLKTLDWVGERTLRDIPTLFFITTLSLGSVCLHSWHLHPNPRVKEIASILLEKYTSLAPPTQRCKVWLGFWMFEEALITLTTETMFEISADFIHIRIYKVLFFIVSSVLLHVILYFLPSWEPSITLNTRNVFWWIVLLLSPLWVSNW